MLYIYLLLMSIEFGLLGATMGRYVVRETEKLIDKWEKENDSKSV